MFGSKTSGCAGSGATAACVMISCSAKAASLSSRSSVAVSFWSLVPTAMTSAWLSRASFVFVAS